jgi:hypothetical protein
MKIKTVSLWRPNDEPVFAGRLDGKRTFMRVLEELPFGTEQMLVVLDFSGAEIATSSFLAELLIPLREHLRLRRPPAYLVAANTNEKVTEEIDELLARVGDAFLIGAATADGRVSDLQLAGRLDAKLMDTFDLVQRKGVTSAVELHGDSGDSDGIGPTAWNNRLAALAAKSLIVEVPQGRSKKYRSLLENA